MRSLLNLTLLAATATATACADSDRTGWGNQHPREPVGWSGSASAELDTPRVLTGQRYRGSFSFHGEAPGDADGELHVYYAHTPTEAASPELVLDLYGADGELLESRELEGATSVVAYGFPAEPLPAGAPFPFTYVVEFELVFGSSAATMAFDAQVGSVDGLGEYAEVPVVAELVGEFVEVEGDTGEEP